MLIGHIDILLTGRGHWDYDREIDSACCAFICRALIDQYVVQYLQVPSRIGQRQESDYSGLIARYKSSQYMFEENPFPVIFVLAVVQIKFVSDLLLVLFCLCELLSFSPTRPHIARLGGVHAVPAWTE
jgi:hypothetical protein